MLKEIFCVKVGDPKINSVAAVYLVYQYKEYVQMQTIAASYKSTLHLYILVLSKVLFHHRNDELNKSKWQTS